MKTFRGALAALTFALVIPAAADAQVAVFDGANYQIQQAQAWVQREQANVQNSQYVKEVESALSLAQQVQNSAAQLRNMQTEATNMGRITNWATLQQHINDMNALLSQMHSLNIQASNMTTQFEKLNPNYQPPANFTKAYATLDTNTQQAAMVALEAAGLTFNDIPNQAVRISQVTASAANPAATAKDLASASVAVGAQAAEQLQKLQSLDALRTQYEISYYMQQRAAQIQQQQGQGAAMAWLKAAQNRMGSTSNPLPQF